ncbi:MAG: prolipoprotein diacylglyceryl transferase [Bacteroidetes bacterium]|nr:MAG: prolipoprotein diacylglyceryl transferase [Bacteroidota bacterium]
MESLIIYWNVSPEIVGIGPLHIRWYGLLFALGFLLAYLLEQRMFRFEGLPQDWLDSAILYVFAGTLLGARLGHVFFYAWDYYSQHPLDILKVWQGGLASHGALIGIVLALWVFSKRVSKLPLLWVLDRAVVSIALAAVFIRTGNLMNSEIFGLPTSLPWGFVFVRVDGVAGPARHPTQIYEALAYLLTFVTLVWLFFKTDARKRPGLLLGVFLFMVFSARFAIEFLKENQAEFESGMVLNMGQLLSIPLILAGIWLIWRALRRAVVNWGSRG